jgi:hypothetical protein
VGVRELRSRVGVAVAVFTPGPLPPSPIKSTKATVEITNRITRAWRKLLYERLSVGASGTDISPSTG